MQIFHRLERRNKKKEFVAVGDQTANDRINIILSIIFLEIKALEITDRQPGERTY